VPSTLLIGDNLGQPPCFALTGTATLRLAQKPREWLERPEDLARWIADNVPAAPVDDLHVDDGLLGSARELREAIYRVAVAIATESRAATSDHHLINEWSARNDAVRVLDGTRARWLFPGEAPARTAIALIAADAVDVLGGARQGSVKVCAGEGCAAVFLDTSRGSTRRWCSMGKCGNRAKRSAMRSRQASPS
jgi:predicted RNA-binding Zn ribbon-like protein